LAIAAAARAQTPSSPLLLTKHTTWIPETSAGSQRWPQQRLLGQHMHFTHNQTQTYAQLQTAQTELAI